MAHTTHDKKKLLNRIRRIRGQLESIEAAVEVEDECSAILQTAAAARGAMNGLVFELLEGHIRHHIVDPELKVNSAKSKAVEEVLKVVKSYLK